MSSVSINDLPPEILGQIFLHYVNANGHKNLLNNVAKVCQRWEEIAHISTVWSHVDQHQENLTVDDVVNFSESGLLSYVQSLKMDDTDHSLTAAKFTAIIRNCHHLLELDVRGETLRVNVSDIAENCHSLQKLQLFNIPKFRFFDHHIYRTSVFTVKMFEIGCPLLRELSLKNIDSVYSDDNDGTGFLLSDASEETTGFPALESLEYFCNRSDEVITLIAQNSPKIRHLSITNLDLDNALKISCSLESLVLLQQLSGILASTKEVFAKIAKRWKHSLQRLIILFAATDFFGLTHYPCDGLEELVNGGSGSLLKFVRLLGIRLDFSSFASFLRGAQNLEYLDVRGCSGLPRKYHKEFHGKAIQDLRESLVNCNQCSKASE